MRTYRVIYHDGRGRVFQARSRQGAAAKARAVPGEFQGAEIVNVVRIA